MPPLEKNGNDEIAATVAALLDLRLRHLESKVDMNTLTLSKEFEGVKTRLSTIEGNQGRMEERLDGVIKRHDDHAASMREIKQDQKDMDHTLDEIYRKSNAIDVVVSLLAIIGSIIASFLGLRQ